MTMKEYQSTKCANPAHFSKLLIIVGVYAFVTRVLQIAVLSLEFIKMTQIAYRVAQGL